MTAINNNNFVLLLRVQRETPIKHFVVHVSISHVLQIHMERLKFVIQNINLISLVFDLQTVSFYSSAQKKAYQFIRAIHFFFSLSIYPSLLVASFVILNLLQLTIIWKFIEQIMEMRWKCGLSTITLWQFYPSTVETKPNSRWIFTRFSIFFSVAGWK